MKEYIMHFCAEKKITLDEFSQALGYKSVTSLKRLMNGDVKSRGYHQFEERIIEKYHLSSNERTALHRIVHGILNNLHSRLNYNAEMLPAVEN